MSKVRSLSLSVRVCISVFLSVCWSSRGVGQQRRQRAPQKLVDEYTHEKTSGKEKLTLQWKKITASTTHASFGDPVGDDTLAMLCVFNDSGTLVKEYLVDRGSQTSGTKPCRKLTGKQGLAYQDKPGSAAGRAPRVRTGPDSTTSETRGLCAPR